MFRRLQGIIRMIASLCIVTGVGAAAVTVSDFDSSYTSPAQHIRSVDSAGSDAAGKPEDTRKAKDSAHISSSDYRSSVAGVRRSGADNPPLPVLGSASAGAPSHAAVLQRALNARLAVKNTPHSGFLSRAPPYA